MVRFITFLRSEDALPLLFSLFINFLSPFFGRYLEREINSNLPEELKPFRDDFIIFSKDGLWRVSFLTSIAVASVAALVILAKNQYPKELLAIPLLLFVGFIYLASVGLRSITPYDLRDDLYFGLKRSRWFVFASVGYPKGRALVEFHSRRRNLFFFTSIVINLAFLALSYHSRLKGSGQNPSLWYIVIIFLILCLFAIYLALKK